MPTSSAPVDVANLALQKIGSLPIASLTDQTNPSAVAANQALIPSYQAVARAHRWNCLMTYAVLNQLVQTPIPPVPPVPPNPPPWAPNTPYAANTYLEVAGVIYLVVWAYTSSDNFWNDLATGVIIQTNLPLPGGGTGGGGKYPSSWKYAYALPSDFLLLSSLNEDSGWRFGCAQGRGWQVMGVTPTATSAPTLYTDASRAVIQYVKNQPDTTQFDPLFLECLTSLLASQIATTLRQDGGKLAEGFKAEYRRALAEARTVNAGEGPPRRHEMTRRSRFVQARYGRGTWND